MRKFKTLEERFEYLRLDGDVGAATFGHDRYMNQEFYRTKAWRATRDRIIIRDEGCDLGVPGYDIHDKIIVHHINPIRPEEILEDSDRLYDPENLIACSNRTHNAIHYGDAEQLPQTPNERRPNDTAPWR